MTRFRAHSAFAFIHSISIGLLLSCSPGETDNNSFAHEAINSENNPNRITAFAEVLEGRLDLLPKSGSVPVWYSNDWPYNSDGTAQKINGALSPLEKYERAFRADDRASEWEIMNHGTAHGTVKHPGWYGHCNGSAAAIVTTPEPKHAVIYRGQTFNVDDLKALLAEVNYGADSAIVGLRCEQEGEDLGLDEYGRPFSNRCRDLNAGSFHVVVANFLGSMGKSPIMDIDNGEQVWNGPIREFSIARMDDVSEGQAAGLVKAGSTEYSFNAKVKRFVRVQMNLIFVYKNDRPRSYEYILEIDAQGKIIGGEWIGSSQKNHPDFIWYPQYPGSQNPFIAFDDVKELVRLSF